MCYVKRISIFLIKETLIDPLTHQGTLHPLQAAWAALPLPVAGVAGAGMGGSP